MPEYPDFTRAGLWHDIKESLIWNPWTLEVSIDVNRNWRTATTPPRRDPLAIDLDGDGIETVGIPSSGDPVLFDHDADGVKTGTGWLKGDDAWLVLDRDGNGSIESGRELFGVDTMVTVTESLVPGAAQQTYRRNARSGFEALATLDANHDGVFNASDAGYAQVRLWQDLNQDGVSQNNELAMLADKGIASIALNGSASSTNLGNGNTVTANATVTRINGSTTQIDSVELQASNLNLASNAFYREFTDSIPLSEQARSLPEMGAAGWVRDMREAISLGTPAGDAFGAVVAQYTQAGTREEQLALMDQLLRTWAKTTGRFDDRSTRAVQSSITADNGVTRTVHYTTVDPSFYGTFDPMHDYVLAVRFDLQGEQYHETVIPSDHLQVSYQVLNVQGQEVLRRLGVVEAFNGSRFFNLDQTSSTSGGGASSSGGGGGGGSGIQAPGLQVYWSTTLSTQQIDALNKAYEALERSVYGALVMQTRLQKYFDAISLTIDENGLHLDATAMVALLDGGVANDPNAALEDLIDLNRYAGDTLRTVGIDAIAKLRSWIDGLAADSPMRATLAALDVSAASATMGSTWADIYLGDANANSFHSGDGDDVIDGGRGNDALFGENGADTLDGGAGDDCLAGGMGADVYLFGLGSGQDTISNDDGDAASVHPDAIELGAGIVTSGVRLSRSADDLIIGINGSDDRLTVQSHFYQESTSPYAVETISFADGTVWDLAIIKTQVLLGGAGADDLVGYASADQITGGDGNDRIWARAGDDSASGGAGNDQLMGGVGNDTLEGGAGNDLLIGGDETGGGWNGTNNYGGTGNDTYRFGRGDGQDTIWDVDGTAGNTDTIVLKEGIAPSDVRISRLATGSVHMLLSIAGSIDTLTVGNFFVGDGSSSLEQISFADGTVWDLATIRARALVGGVGADDIIGYAGDDRISGGDGNDRIWARAGDDSALGGAGNDQLVGEAGNDTLEGGAGNDLLIGGDETGGAWNGTNNYGGTGNDTYRFGRGDGQDTIWDVDGTAGNIDTIVSKEGIAPSDVRISRLASGSVHLLLSITGSTDTLTVGNFFVGEGGSSIEQITFADGTIWDLAAIKARALVGGAGADDIIAYAGDDQISGADGNDRLWARAGSDTVLGGAGNDTAWGEEGNDSLNGGDGGDTLFGGVGNDTLEGGAGNDLLIGGDETSGAWNGTNYYSGQGNDNYRFGRGDGQDTIWDVDSTAGNIDTIALKEGIAPSDVRISRMATGSVHLLLSIAGSTDTLAVGNFFVGDGSSSIEQISFADGTIWDLAAIKTRALLPTAAADDIGGYGGDDQINGADGNDRIWGRTGNDTLSGGAGSDQIWGEAGNDIIEGGAGNDLLVGGNDNGGSWNGSNYYTGQGDDIYRFGRGDGQDTVWDVDSTAGNQDVLSFLSGVSADQLWFRQVGSALEVSIIGTNDRVQVANWFAGANYHVEKFQTARGQTLLDSNVQNLVNAMAAFAPPAIGQTTLPANYQSTLLPTIASNWVGG
jgi:Ca2+-binding RTX toxin-like protein